MEFHNMEVWTKALKKFEETTPEQRKIALANITQLLLSLCDFIKVLGFWEDFKEFAGNDNKPFLSELEALLWKKSHQ